MDVHTVLQMSIRRMEAHPRLVRALYSTSNTYTYLPTYTESRALRLSYPYIDLSQRRMQSTMPAPGSDSLDPADMDQLPHTLSSAYGFPSEMEVEQCFITSTGVDLVHVSATATFDPHNDDMLFLTEKGHCRHRRYAQLEDLVRRTSYVNEGEGMLN